MKIRMKPAVTARVKRGERAPVEGNMVGGNAGATGGSEVARFVDRAERSEVFGREGALKLAAKRGHGRAIPQGPRARLLVKRATWGAAQRQARRTISRGCAPISGRRRLLASAPTGPRQPFACDELGGRPEAACVCGTREDASMYKKSCVPWRPCARPFLSLARSQLPLLVLLLPPSLSRLPARLHRNTSQLYLPGRRSPSWGARHLPSLDQAGKLGWQRAFDGRPFVISGCPD
jgi:hypothetical protein